MEIVKTGQTGLADREWDYLIVTIFVLAQHGHFDRARTLVEGMKALGDTSGEITLARAVVSFFCNDFDLTVECLDELDGMIAEGKFRKSDDTMRMRTYLRARCYFQMGRTSEAQDIATMLAATPEKARAS